MNESDLNRTAKHWGGQGPWQVGRGLFWLELPAVQRRLNYKVSGQDDVSWIDYTLKRYSAGQLPLSCCLSIGCGEGSLERQLAKRGTFVSCDAFDIATDSITRARATAQSEGHLHINYTVQDGNRAKLEPGRYDAIWGNGSFHHIANLEHLLGQVSQALKPTGYLVLNEYVGPNRFQFPARQRQIIEACFDLLPPEYRRLVRDGPGHNPEQQSRRKVTWFLRRLVEKAIDGTLWNAIWQRLKGHQQGPRLVKMAPNLPTSRAVQSIDPSEAVRSADILPLVHQYLQVVEVRPLGGSILQFLLADIAGNFQDEAGEQLLQMLFSIEDALVVNGYLASDFIYLVATPRK